MRYALIHDGIVKNVIEWDGNTETWSPSEGTVAIAVDSDTMVGPGFFYDGSTFVQPVVIEPVPDSVTPLQMRKALRQLGMKPTIDAFLSTLDEEALEEWEYATAIDRYNPTLMTAAGLLPMTEGQVDDLFRLAASL